MLRNILRVLLFSIAVFFVFGFVRKIYPAPCATPITYKIGTFDTNFGISRENFLTDLEDASKVWSTIVGKPLFAYDLNGSLTIDLIYDERQKTTEQNKELEADAKKTGALAGDVKRQYEGLEADLATEKKSYDIELAQFDAEEKDYETNVAYWNARGGAPSGEYEKLVVQQHQLEKMQANLESKRTKLNARVAEINTFVQKYNLLVRDANSTIHTLNQTAGKEFQEGSYDPNTDTISIYEFSTKAKLLRIMAHELGHALSLDHNSDPKSIMYELNQGSTLTPSAADKAALMSVCQAV